MAFLGLLVFLALLTLLSSVLRSAAQLALGLPWAMHVPAEILSTLFAPSLGVEMTIRKFSSGSMDSVCCAHWLLVPTSVLLRKSAAQEGPSPPLTLLLSRQTSVVLHMNEASLRRVLLDCLLAEATCLIRLLERCMSVQNEDWYCGLRPWVLQSPMLPMLSTRLTLWCSTLTTVV